MRAAASLLALAAVAPVALAGPFFTAPVAGTSCAAGQPCTISWNDDGKAPSLADYGDCTIGVYAGSAQQQSLMQAVSPANAASTGSVVFTPDPAMGENSNAYFIKMISVNTPDPAMPQYKATAYSAMFTLTGMTGTFNQTVKDQIAGTAASSGAATGAPPATSAPATTPVTSSVIVTTKATASSTKSAAASSTASAAANGANSVAVAGMGAFGATVVAVLAAFF
ncbi:GPI-anchored small secreted protein [Ceratobasidium sp. AG-Ba]|nr:GPI-anchored small secreted protein [Ceratobasidium sp. AG-Ba]